MASVGPQITQNNTTINLSGAWTTRHLSDLPQIIVPTLKDVLTLDAQRITSFDTAGALLLNQYITELKARKLEYTLKEFKPEWTELMSFVAENPPQALPPERKEEENNLIASIGKEAIDKAIQFFSFFDFIGRLASVFCRSILEPKRFHLTSIVNVLDQSGCRSLPIVGLLCFLIGVVLAYQLGMQLKSYGANIFIVYLTGIAILREFGPLITAIILAGRTSSSFTAEIGSMKVNQEIDALLTMGLLPSEFLVIPKIIGLLIVFPLLIFWADIFGVLGSMFMAKVSLGIGYKAFLQEFAANVEIRQLFIGLSKAPVFALIIVLIGCYQGFHVEYSADSVGKKTTKSVVQAIFLIIIADAAFSVLYSMLGL